MGDTVVERIGEKEATWVEGSGWIIGFNVASWDCFGQYSL